MLESGGTIQAETRGFDAATNKTFKLRGKESAPDYRYMPEPDLPPLYLDQVIFDKKNRKENTYILLNVILF
jgi:aspartyl-tRNA(Asn)/glutamyl-tRNA(Gln) amidotransferase subunit B